MTIVLTIMRLIDNGADIWVGQAGFGDKEMRLEFDYACNYLFPLTFRSPLSGDRVPIRPTTRGGRLWLIDQLLARRTPGDLLQACEEGLLRVEPRVPS